MTSSCSLYASWLSLSALRDQTMNRSQNLTGQTILTGQILMCRKRMKIHHGGHRELLILDSGIFGKGRHSRQDDESQVVLVAFRTCHSVSHDLLATLWEQIQEQVSVSVHTHFLALDDLVNVSRLEMALLGNEVPLLGNEVALLGNEVALLGNGCFLTTRNNIAQHTLSRDWKRMNHGDRVEIVDHVTMNNTRLWMDSGS